MSQMRHFFVEVNMQSYKVDENTLLEVPFIFDGISNDEARKILEHAEYTLARYSKGEKIFDTESYERSIAFILNGKAEVYRANVSRRTLLSSLSTGDSFGASVLFGDNEPFPTAIFAKSDCDIMFIAQEQMEILISSFPQIAMNYIKFLSKKIRFLNDKISSFSSKSAEEKAAKFLLDNSIDGKLSSKLNMKQISSSLGLGRASLYRTLSAFEEKGLISKNCSEISIKNFEGLKKIIN